MTLLIDNYDSFTYNLYQLIGALDGNIAVVRNDKITIDRIRELSPSWIVISPGPGRPETAGICYELILELGKQTPILGVCLGHQAIAHAFGADVKRASKPMHGKVSTVYHDREGLYDSLPQPLNVVRYHSLIVERSTLPNCLRVTAETEDGIIMGLRHKSHPIEGIQFHPESILTEYGSRMISNWFSNHRSGK